MRAQDRQSDGAEWRAAAAVVAVAFLAYANTLGHGFVFDDVPNIAQNRWIRSIGHLPEIFTAHVAGFDVEFATSYYRPMMHVLYMMVYAVAGLRPPAFHLANVMAHVLVSLLAFRVARLLVGRLGSSGTEPAGSWDQAPLLAALLFAAHPAHTEAVAWLGGITDVSFSLFGMLAVLTYLRARTPLGAVGAAVWFLLACLSKEPAITIILILGTIEAVQIRGGRASVREAAARMGPMAVAAALYGSMRWVALGGFAPGVGPHRYDVFVSILTGLQLLGQYLRTLVVPAPLNALHMFRAPASIAEPGVLLGLVAGAALIAAGVAARREPLGLTALVWMVAPLLPVLYTPALGEVPFAERYLYFPSFGFALLLAWGWGALRARLGVPARAAVVLPLVVVVVYAGGTVARNPVWRDHLSLWSDTARKSPGSAVAQEYLCFALYDAGRFAEAASTCRRALALDSTRLDARTNLGTALAVLGEFGEAGRQLDEVIRRRPNSVQALTTRGLIYMATGEPDRALASYRAALAFDPNNAEAHNVLGVALARLGRVDEAIRALREAVRLAPDRIEYRENLRALTAPASRPAR